jgi:hypothetical protein
MFCLDGQRTNDGTDSGETDQTHGFKGSFIWSGPSVGTIVRLLYRIWDPRIPMICLARKPRKPTFEN